MDSTVPAYTGADPIEPEVLVSEETLQGLRDLAEVLRRISRRLEIEERLAAMGADLQPPYEP